MTDRPRRLLVVHHSATGHVADMTAAVLRGARDPAITDVEIGYVAALEAKVEDVLWADAYVLGTPANFGYMSGALKHFFDTIYHPCLDATQGRPYGLYVKGDTDTTGAVESVQRIVAGLAWKMVQPPVACVGALDAGAVDACEELGRVVAGGLSVGLW